MVSHGPTGGYDVCVNRTLFSNTSQIQTSILITQISVTLPGTEFGVLICSSLAPTNHRPSVRCRSNPGECDNLVDSMLLSGDR